MSRKNGIWVLLVIVMASLAVYYVKRRGGPERIAAYPEPRFPAHLVQEPDEQELLRIARKMTRQTAGRSTKLGLLSPGEKALIMIPPDQDRRVLKAILAALKERGVEADFVYDYELTEGGGGRKVTGDFYGRGRGVQDGSREGYRWPSVLPEAVVREADPNLLWAAGRVRVGSEEQVQAVKRYLEKHPEYTSFLGSSSGYFRRAAERKLRGKYRSRWVDTTLWEFLNNNRKFANDVLKSIEDKVLEVLPWVQEVRVTDPEGTDFTFSLTEEEAGLWSKGAYGGWIMVSPFQATHGLYGREGIKKLVVPNVRGMIAGTAGHSGWYPRVKVYFENGRAQRVEGGGKVGEFWKMYLEHEKLKKAHYPYVPHEGFLYLYEGILGLDPKLVVTHQEGPPMGRAGIIHWGFGVDSALPEMEEYARKHDLPLGHGLHIHTFFPSYEVIVTGGKKIKIVDKGHLTALDDLEVRALASRYGKAEEILREEFVPGIPGINAPGDYVKDYANDPVSHARRQWEEIKSGTYKYLTRSATDRDERGPSP